MQLKMITMVLKKKREEKIVTATKKGAAVLDQWIPDHIKNQYRVLQKGDDVPDAMLNQTNIGDNNNKFFVLQVLESDNTKTYMVYFRWGRVGVKENIWASRNDFIPHHKSCTWIELDYGEEEEEKDPVVNDIPKSSSSSKVKPGEAKLDTRVAKIISFKCNVSMMAQHMM